MITREFNLYLHAGHSIPLVINCNQYDRGEQWLFTLFNADGTQYVPSSGAIVGIKSDNLGIINSGTVDSQGRVVINETQQMTASVGKAVFELLIDSQTHGTANFVVLVEEKPGNNADMSESDLSLLQEAIDATSPLPTGGTVGQVLTKTANGSAWSDAGTPTQEQVASAVSDWADENITVTTGVVIDQSLSVSGAAADAKKTGDEISDLKSQIQQNASDISAEETRAKAEEERLEELFTAPTQEAVDNWLNNHPEATTTVEDNSLTYAKLVTGTLGFVTPEMYGAKGDGVTDDTQAIQAAFDSGLSVIAKSTIYKITQPVIFSGYYKSIDFTNSTIVYSGPDSAVIIQGVSGLDAHFGRINAVYGNGIEFRADSRAHKSQYVRLYFLTIQTGGKGVWFNVTNDGWANEISVYGGVFVSSGVYGIYIDNTPNDANYSINSLKFYNVAGEVSNNFIHYYINSPSYSADGITIFYPRYYEFVESNLITTIGYVSHLNFYGSNHVYESRFNFSQNTRRTYIHAPVESADSTTLLGDAAKYHNGAYSFLHYSDETRQVTGFLNSATGQVIFRRNGNVVSVNVADFKPSVAVGELLSAAIGEAYRPTAITSFVLYGSDGTVARAFCRTNGLIGSTALSANVLYNGSVTYIL